MYYNKVIVVFLFLFIAVGTVDSKAQNTDFDLLAKIIKTGNAKDLAKQFSKSVELNIDGKEATYSQAQAEAVLKSFFDKNAPQEFAINHKGASKGGLPYAIGEYKSGTGSYRVWIRLKTVNSKNLVYEMSFIKE
ncbi:MAG: DUF4783 domain-containing protein [Bacteroidetes bacterium]|nr:MAG: DUF4783 domain-containing protein [Bacteroidota bacterium]